MNNAPDEAVNRNSHLLVEDSPEWVEASDLYRELLRVFNHHKALYYSVTALHPYKVMGGFDVCLKFRATHREVFEYIEGTWLFDQPFKDYTFMECGVRTMLFLEVAVAAFEESPVAKTYAPAPAGMTSPGPRYFYYLDKSILNSLGVVRKIIALAEGELAAFSKALSRFPV